MEVGAQHAALADGPWAGNALQRAPSLQREVLSCGEHRKHGWGPCSARVGTVAEVQNHGVLGGERKVCFLGGCCPEEKAGVVVTVLSPVQRLDWANITIL